MLDLIKLLVTCMFIWIIWLAVPIAAALVGTVAALMVLSFLLKVVDEDPDDDDGKHSDSHHTEDS